MLATLSSPSGSRAGANVLRRRVSGIGISDGSSRGVPLRSPVPHIGVRRTE